jgi:hypothetical protein
MPLHCTSRQVSSFSVLRGSDLLIFWLSHIRVPFSSSPFALCKALEKSLSNLLALCHLILSSFVVQLGFFGFLRWRTRATNASFDIGHSSYNYWSLYCWLLFMVANISLIITCLNNKQTVAFQSWYMSEQHWISNIGSSSPRVVNTVL